MNENTTKEIETKNEINNLKRETMKYDPIKNFEELSNDTIIWRYMNFTSFVNMFKTDQIYFSSIKEFSQTDHFEGLHYLNDEISENLSKSNSERLGIDAQSMMNYIKTLNIRVNCWFEGEYESVSMWKLYGLSDGIAIQSTIGNLKQAIETESNSITYSINKVNYKSIDEWKNLNINSEELYLTKVNSYKHENEIRIILKDLNDDSGKKLPTSIYFNLEKLINKIYISPDAKSYVKNLVDSIIKEKIQNLKVEYSKLRRPDFKNKNCKICSLEICKLCEDNSPVMEFIRENILKKLLRVT